MPCAPCGSARRPATTSGELWCGRWSSWPCSRRWRWPGTGEPPGADGALVQLAPRHRQAGLAARPGRVPRVVGHALAAQRGVRILRGDQVAELLEAVVVGARDIAAGGVHVGAADG